MKFIHILFLALLLAGCETVSDHRKALDDSSEQKITLGVAQKEIKVGMSQGDVATAIGSPNMVTKDKDSIETWIYEKVSTDYAYSTSSGGLSSLILGIGSSVAGGLGTGVSKHTGAASRTQRTLTIIIKFKKSEVSEFTYNATSF